MSRIALFLVLLLAVGVVLADNASEAEHAAPAGEAQAQPEEAADSAPGAAEPQAKTDQDAESATALSQTPAQPAEEAESADAAAEPQEKTEGDASESKKKTQDGAQEMSGMSVLGNREAPKSLVIVPWKSSVIGDSLGISTLLDDSRQPVDREEFLRELSYYEIRSEKTP